jgi:hypothetical protein
VAHVSHAAPEEVYSLVTRLGPAAVVIELDVERLRLLQEAAEADNDFGLSRFKKVSPIRVLFSGRVFPHVMGLVNVISGALLGTTPGGEFLAAKEAAEEAGAILVLADRPQQVTLDRLRYYSEAVTRHSKGRSRKSGRGDAERLHRHMEAQARRSGDAGAGPSSSSSAAAAPSSEVLDVEVGIGGNSEGEEERGEQSRAAAEVAEATGGAGPWGLGSEEDELGQGVEAIKRRFLRMMREGGCDDPQRALDAGRRLFSSGERRVFVFCVLIFLFMLPCCYFMIWVVFVCLVGIE